MAHHVHRPQGLGSRVLINADWYKMLQIHKLELVQLFALKCMCA